MIFAIILADLLFYTSETFSHIWSLFGVFLVFVIGFLDDHRDSSPKTKFITIFIAVLFFYQDGIVIDSLGTIFGINLPLGWLAIPFTMFAVAGFTNALNLSDGLDGLAGSLSFVVLSVLCYIGFQNNDGFIVSLSASFMAAIAAFLIFNWNPAKIFMGDSGSLTLGAVIALLSIKALDYIQPTAILFLAALPIKDTIIVMIRRKLNGSSMFSADKTHIHHVMLKFFNGNIKKTVVLLALLQLFYSLIALSFIENDYKQRYILTLFILSLTISYILLDTMLNCQNNPLNCHRKKLKKNK